MNIHFSNHSHQWKMLWFIKFWFSPQNCKRILDLVTTTHTVIRKTYKMYMYGRQTLIIYGIIVNIPIE